MTTTVIRPAFPRWPELNRSLRDRVSTMTREQLSIIPGLGRWPIWATIGHVACQRVFWLCDFAGEPGAEASPFPDAGNNCPGDDDLEHVWSGDRLVEALGRTFAIVERCLDTWTLESLSELISRSEGGRGRVHSRGFVLERVLSHDVWHTAELNEALGAAGLAQIDIWG